MGACKRETGVRLLRLFPGFLPGAVPTVKRHDTTRSVISDQRTSFQ